MRWRLKIYAQDAIWRFHTRLFFEGFKKMAACTLAYYSGSVEDCAKRRQACPEKQGKREKRKHPRQPIRAENLKEEPLPDCQKEDFHTSQ
jgi:hypothetical protein